MGTVIYLKENDLTLVNDFGPIKKKQNKAFVRCVCPFHWNWDDVVKMVSKLTMLIAGEEKITENREI